jgi:phosphoglucosamine mutase
MKLFGTDGIRGLANHFPMTGDVAMRVGRALVYTLAHEMEGWGAAGPVKGARPKIRIVIGKDTRRSGYMIETALASGICSMGGEAIFLGPIPTPGVAFITMNMRADAGVMISASHNPFEDNGIKIFGSDGYKAPDEIESAIERLVLHPEEMDSVSPTGMDIGKAYRIEEAVGRYVVFLKATLPQSLDLVGVRIALDCANGASYKAAPMTFEELGADVVSIGVSPDGSNVNLNSGALHPAELSQVVVEQKTDLGVAFDGDADRAIFVDENGQVVDGDQILGLLALDLKERKQLKGDLVIATPMSNLGLELGLRDLGIRMVRAAVGDRFVVEQMRKLGANLGGENSGHLILGDYATTGDGILAALQVLSIMRRRNRPLSELVSWVQKTPQFLTQVRVNERRPLDQCLAAQEAIRAVEASLQDRGRVFVRYSGTEAVLRILVEGQDEKTVCLYGEQIADAFRSDFQVSGGASK